MQRFYFVIYGVVLGGFLLLSLTSCAAIQANPTVTAGNELVNAFARRAPDEVREASLYGARKIEQAETSGRKVKVSAFCGEVCGVGESKAQFEMAEYQELGVGFFATFCPMTCGVQPLQTPLPPVDLLEE